MEAKRLFGFTVFILVLGLMFVLNAATLSAMGNSPKKEIKVEESDDTSSNDFESTTEDSEDANDDADNESSSDDDDDSVEEPSYDEDDKSSNDY